MKQIRTFCTIKSKPNYLKMHTHISMELRKGIKHVKPVHIDDCCVNRELGSAQFHQGTKTLQKKLLYVT